MIVRTYQEDLRHDTSAAVDRAPTVRRAADPVERDGVPKQMDARMDVSHERARQPPGICTEVAGHATDLLERGEVSLRVGAPYVRALLVVLVASLLDVYVEARVIRA